MDESDLSAAPRTKRQSRPNPKYLQSQSSESEYELSASDEEDEPVSKKKKRVNDQNKVAGSVKKKRDLLPQKISPPRSFNERMDEYEERGKKKDKFMSQNLFLYKHCFLYAGSKDPLTVEHDNGQFPDQGTYIHSSTVVTY